MSIDSEEELAAMREAGRVVRQALEAMRAEVAPGRTTAELNAVGAQVIRRNGARSAPMLVYGFPAEVCISVNDEIVHGIPSERTLVEGDLAKLDVTVEKNGFMADAAITVPVGEISDDARRMIDTIELAFGKAMEVARAGNQIREIGRAIQVEVEGRGFSIMRELVGHGIGRTIHEDPLVPNFDDPRATTLLTDGLVITVEPMIALGSALTARGDDGWTILTADGSASAHLEQTLVITDGAPILLTAP